jgi:phage baseplate assembly protein gpV
MGLLDGTTQGAYYQGGEKGGYQFTSLEDIINQFLVAYVGEEKIINKVSRMDVAFHAQRAMQELSFDTFKSIKSQEVIIPPSSVMILPHDYVNYTDVSWVNSSGVKIPLYPTSNTSNPTSLMQDDNGSYFFQGSEDLVKNGDFSDNLDSTTNWNYSNVRTQATAIDPFTYSSNQFPPQIASFDDATCDYDDGTTVTHDDDDGEIEVGMTVTGTGIPVGAVVASVTSDTEFELSEATTGGSVTDGTLTFASPSWNYALKTNLRSASNQGVLNEDSIKIENGALAVTTMNYLWNGYRNTDVGSHCYAVWQQIDVSSFNVLDISAVATSHASTAICGNGIIKFGLSTEPGSHAINPFNQSDPIPHQKNVNPAYIPGGYLEWNDGNAVATEKTLAGIDVTTYNTLYVVMSFRTIWSQMGGGTGTDYIKTNTIDNISVQFTGEPSSLRLRERSLTWDSYKSNTPTENQNQYNDDTYWPVEGSRFGLDPQHTQTNGSFYIDNLKGLVHFSSNIPGKTVILDYISDSLGTDGEMQVHKFAEEAMYRWILHAIAASRIQTQQLVPRLKKEKIAAIRQAKLRLSNIKLEELTQILRGKSKHIKH